MGGGWGPVDRGEGIKNVANLVNNIVITMNNAKWVL